MTIVEKMSRLAKTVMNASVDAQLLGLVQVSSYLDMAFDEVVRVAVKLNTEAEAVEVGEPVGVGGEVAGGS